jgi:hypothetical protein
MDALEDMIGERISLATDNLAGKQSSPSWLDGKELRAEWSIR